LKTRQEQRTQQRDWHNAAYKKNPEKYRERSRNRRLLHGMAINAQRRNRAEEKRGVALELKADAARNKLGREPRTLSEWFQTQSKFFNWAQLARVAGVSRRTVFDWRNGKHPAVRVHRRKLYEITGLACFADAANWKPREKPARKIGEEGAVALLAELVVRCGLATREIQRLRIPNPEDVGIRLGNGRLIPFGDKWEEVSRASLDSWLTRARPTDYLFFSRKPVDRNRPVSSVWIARTLRATGILLQRRRAARLRHFAGDFARLGSGKRFTDHLARIHGLSRSGSREALEILRTQKARISDQALTKCEPKDAFDLLFPLKNKGGRPAVKREMFLDAKRLKDTEDISWPEIARRLDPNGFKESPRKAGERIRLGVTSLSPAKS
jgi:hypothetical protein